MTTSSDPYSELDRLASSLLQARPGPRLMSVDLYREAVDVDGQLLTIRAQRTAPRTEGAKWLVQERPAGHLPPPVQHRRGCRLSQHLRLLRQPRAQSGHPSKRKGKTPQDSCPESAPDSGVSPGRRPIDEPKLARRQAPHRHRTCRGCRARNKPTRCFSFAARAESKQGRPFPDAERRNTRPCKTGRRACTQPSGLSTVIHPLFTKGVLP